VITKQNPVCSLSLRRPLTSGNFMEPVFKQWSSTEQRV
jgi:hypothetical protein